MALQPASDLLIVYRPDEQKHYNLTVDDLPSSDGVDDGTTVGQILKWNGAAWEPSLEIDCGATDLGSGNVDYPAP